MISRATFSRSLRQIRQTRLPTSQWRLEGRRRYASASETAEKAKQAGSSFFSASEIPWLIGSLAITVPGTYYILANGPTETDTGMPGSKWHGPDHDEEHEEDEEGEDKEEGDGEEGGEGEEEGEKEGAGEEADGKESKEDDGKDDTPDDKEESKSDDEGDAKDEKTDEDGDDDKGGSTTIKKEGKAPPEKN